MSLNRLHIDWTTVFEAAIEGWALRGVELPPVSEAATVVVVAFLGCCADEGGVKKAHNFDTLPLLLLAVALVLATPAAAVL